MMCCVRICRTLLVCLCMVWWSCEVLAATGMRCRFCAMFKLHFCIVVNLLFILFDLGCLRDVIYEP